MTSQNDSYFYSNQTTYDDPFTSKPSVTEPNMNFRKNKRPFEDVVKESFTSILCLVGSLIIFCLLSELFFREFFPFGSFYFSATSLAAIIFVAALFGYLVVFIVKNIKKAVASSDVVDNFNPLSFLGFQLAVFVAAKLSYLFAVPNKILFIIVLAAICAFMIVLFKKMHDLDKKFFTAGIILLFATITFFLTMRVFLVTELRNGNEIHTECFCFQSKSVDHFDKSAHAVQSDLFVEDYSTGEFYGSSIIRESLLKSKTELGEFFLNEIRNLQKVRPDDTVSVDIAELMKETIEPSFQKYDDEFFRTHSIMILESGYFCTADNMEADAVYTKASDRSLNIHVNIHLYDGMTDNNGNCIILVELPKKYESIFEYDYFFVKQDTHK